MNRTFKIHTLGCGSAKPSIKYNTSCTVVEFDNRLFVVDCGEGAQRSFLRFKLKMSKITDIFLTHLHGDHVLGLPGLISSLSLQNSTRPITIHTFAEGKKILSKIFNYFAREPSFEIKFNILDPDKEEIALENDRLRVRTIPLNHTVDCVGYVFEEKPLPRHINPEMCKKYGVPFSEMNKIKMGNDFITPEGEKILNSLLTSDPSPSLSYAHIGDTAYFPEIADKIGPVDLLMHETTYLKNNIIKAKERGHSTASQAAMMAKKSGAKWLLTGHYSSAYTDESPFWEEASEIFPNTLANYDGFTITLPYNPTRIMPD